MFLLSCSYQLPVPAPKCTRPISSPHIIWPLPQPPHVLLVRVAQSSLSWRWARVARSREPDVFLAPLCSSCQLASHYWLWGRGVCEFWIWGRLNKCLTIDQGSLVRSRDKLSCCLLTKCFGLRMWKKEEDLKSVPQFCLQWCTRSQCGVVR